jgi:fibronectin type 3 domain-containing protein
LIWTANTEADLAGYNVERRKNGSEFVKLNAKILATPIYRDFSVETGTKYSYRVRALDRAGNVSAPSREVEVEAR